MLPCAKSVLFLLSDWGLSFSPPPTASDAVLLEILGRHGALGGPWFPACDTLRSMRLTGIVRSDASGYRPTTDHPGPRVLTDD